MSEYIPSTRSVMHGYVSTMNRKRDMQPMEAKAAFRRWLAEVERAAAEKAWGEGYDEWAQAPAGDQPPRDNPYPREGA